MKNTKYTPADFTVREAVKEDIPQILGMVKELAAFVGSPEAVSAGADEFLEWGFGPEPLYGCFLVSHGSETVAMALYNFRFSTWKGRIMQLDDLYVKPDYRGCGLGKLLFAHLARKADSKNCRRIHWQVIEDNEAGIAFYKKLGAEIETDWYNSWFTNDQFARLSEGI